MELEKLQLQGIEEKRPLVIAGPCSAETEDQVMECAKELKKNGIKIFRAGIWKPRTKPGGFEGNGVTALPWLQQVKKEHTCCLEGSFLLYRKGIVALRQEEK